MKPLRFGILGTGRICRRVVPAMKRARGVLPVAMASRGTGRARAASRSFGLEGVTGYEALLRRPDIDAVYLPLPEGLHAEWAARTARAGKHVLCEKTLAPSLRQAEAMLAACRKAGVRLMEAFMFRFHAQQSLAARLARTRIGPVRLVQSRLGFWYGEKRNYRLDPGLGGGSLNDVGCYPVSAARLFMRREPLAVTATLHKDPGFRVDTGGGALLEFGEGASALVAFGFRMSLWQGCEIWGEKGRLEMPRPFVAPPAAEIVERRGVLAGTRPRRRTAKGPDQYVAMLEAFAAEIRRPGSAGFDFESEALAQARVMQAIRDSARAGKKVRLAR